jgi:hypothetical protein
VALDRFPPFAVANIFCRGFMRLPEIHHMSPVEGHPISRAAEIVIGVTSSRWIPPQLCQPMISDELQNRTWAKHNRFKKQ